MWIILYYVNRLAMHEESTSRRKVDDDVQDGAVPAYLLDRENTTRAKVKFLMLFGYYDYKSSLLFLHVLR
jgi:hypothetical protein